MELTSMIKNKGKVVKEPIEEHGIWIFADTKCRVDKKVTYTWNSLFQAFQDKDFLMLLQDYVSTELRKEVYRHINKSWLHRPGVKTLVLPCPDVIEWITRKIDHHHRSIINYEGKSVASYKSSVFNQMYHLKEAYIKLSPKWLRQKSESVDLLTILKGWWSEVNFKTKSAAAEWKTSKFRKSVQNIVIFLSRVFGRKNGSTFLDKWIPIIYQIITSGENLNWG
jgi:hypothetical protein